MFNIFKYFKVPKPNTPNNEKRISTSTTNFGPIFNDIEGKFAELKQYKGDHQAAAFLFAYSEMLTNIMTDKFVETTLLSHHNNNQGFSLLTSAVRTSYNLYTCDEQPFYLKMPTPVLISPWNSDRIINGFSQIGIPFDNPYDNKTKASYTNNAEAAYLYPFGIALVTMGNHSQYVALTRGELTSLRIVAVYDFTDYVSSLDFNKGTAGIQFDGINIFSDEHGLVQKYPEYPLLFKIGKLLSTVPNEFPNVIQTIVKKKPDYSRSLV